MIYIYVHFVRVAITISYRHYASFLSLFQDDKLVADKKAQESDMKTRMLAESYVSRLCAACIVQSIPMDYIIIMSDACE